MNIPTGLIALTPDGKRRANRLSEIIEAPKNRITEFLKGCKANSLIDQDIVKTWEEHFKKVDVPYVVVKNFKDEVTILKFLR